MYILKTCSKSENSLPATYSWPGLYASRYKHGTDYRKIKEYFVKIIQTNLASTLEKEGNSDEHITYTSQSTDSIEHRKISRSVPRADIKQSTA